MYVYTFNQQGAWCFVFDILTFQLGAADQTGHGSGWSLFDRLRYPLSHGP